MEVIDGCYIGGLDHATELVLSHEAMPSDFCLLVGYSQWSPGQLRREVEDGTWWILSASQGVVTECLRGEAAAAWGRPSVGLCGATVGDCW